MRQAPVLQRVGDRPPPGLDIGQHLDGGLQARGGRHLFDLGVFAVARA